VSTDQKAWLSLAEASERLGVHQTTLRRWADAKQIPCFRTPGGHRRFRVDDLTAWMNARQTAVPSAPTPTAVQNVIGFTRHQMAERHVSESAWYVAFDREGERQQMREMGRRLMGLAIHAGRVGRTQYRESVLDQGRRIGDMYGRQCAKHGVSLADTMRGFFFFRESLLRATRPDPGTGDQVNPERLRHFMNEVMYACLSGYEARGRAHE
jgi:excisionase family DNA binding protein